MNNMKGNLKSLEKKKQEVGFWRYVFASYVTWLICGGEMWK